jgi:glycosyltransferase involved in cell wall biosynthesis
VEYVHYSELLQSGCARRQKGVHRLFTALSRVGYLHPAPWLETLTCDEDFDLIHIHGFDVRLGGKIAHLPVVLGTSSYGPAHCEEYLGWSSKKITRYHARLRRTFRLLGVYDACNNLRDARSLLVWSEAARNFHLLAGVKPERIAVIPPGIEIPATMERSFSEPPEILFVGTDFSRKGGDVLLAAWKKLQPSQAKLLLIGGEVADLPEEVEHHSYISPEELKSRFYPHAQIFAFPTRAEGYGMVVLEAMAYGLAVVASRIGAIPEMVADGETGFLVEPEATSALAEKLAMLIANPEIRRKMGEAGRRRALELFGVERRNRLLATVYRTALEKATISASAQTWCEELG